MNSNARMEQLFDIGYGNKLDLKQMTLTEVDDPEGISFVSRSRQNLGVAAYVKPYQDKHPFGAGLISVALGGTYLLSAFVQERPFYTAQNVAVLTPKAPMTFSEKLFYCLCLGGNRPRYSAFGREANRTLGSICVPAEVPTEFVQFPLETGEPSADPLKHEIFELDVGSWKEFPLSDWFTVSGTKTTSPTALEAYGDGVHPYVTTKATNNGTDGFYDHATEPGNVLVVDSAVLGYCSFQAEDFTASDHVEKLAPRFQMNSYIALFLTTVINLEHHRYNYGRKASQQRLRKGFVKLPATDDGNPDWSLMENFIKSLPYSINLIAE